MKRILLPILVVGLILLSACGVPSSAPPASTPTPAPPVSTSPTQPTTTPTLVFYFDGSTNKTSENFNITREGWYINWECQLEDSKDPTMIFQLYALTEDGKPTMGGVVSTTSPGSDRTYIHSGAGLYYITVMAVNAKWKIEVYE